jgi:hypothetical protein
MTVDNQPRPSLDIDRLIEGISLSHSPIRYPLEFAPRAKFHKATSLLVGQQLWSLPLPFQTLDQTARRARANVLMLRDMKDREPVMSVRCDAAAWIGDSLLTVRDLIPHFAPSSPPSFVSAELNIALDLNEHGVDVTSARDRWSHRERVEGFEMAARILVGPRQMRFVA